MVASPATSDEVIPLWINGESFTSPALKKFPVRSAKANDKILHYALSANVAAATKACDSAAVGFENWKRTSAVERRDLLLRAADLILERKDEFITTQMEETSATEFWATTNVKTGVSHIREIASKITSLSGVIPESRLDYALAFREPIGVTLAIPPWNAPIVLGARALVTPLGAGCAVVLKASELSPKTHYMLVQALFDAGLPKDAVSIVQADREDAPAVTEALISHPAIRKVEFIGSAPIGRIIGSLCGKHLKPVMMELGGKCAVIVLEDADLEDAAFKSIVAAFNHHGQVCFSTDRIYVVRSVADKFIEMLKATASNVPVGGAVSQRLAQAAAAKLIDAEEKGAKFLHGSSEFKDKSSATLTPSILTGVTKEMEIFDEESFGPTVAVYTVDDQEEALKLVNASSYGLVGSVFTRDLHRGIDIARRMETGIAHVNGMTAYDESTLPLGGAKNSGWGRTNSLYGLENFSVLKLVTVSTKPGLPW